MSGKDKEDPLWWAEKISEGGIVLGVGLTAEHRINYGRWYDEDKEICHAKNRNWLVCRIFNCSHSLCYGPCYKTKMPTL